MPKIDTPVATSNKPAERGKRWVEVPKEDIFELPFPSIRVNLLEFGPGKHFVDADLADWIEDRVAVRQRECDAQIFDRIRRVTHRRHSPRLGRPAFA